MFDSVDNTPSRMRELTTLNSECRDSGAIVPGATFARAGHHHTTSDQNGIGTNTLTLRIGKPHCTWNTTGLGRRVRLSMLSGVLRCFGSQTTTENENERLLEKQPLCVHKGNDAHTHLAPVAQACLVVIETKRHCQLQDHPDTRVRNDRYFQANGLCVSECCCNVRASSRHQRV